MGRSRNHLLVLPFVLLGYLILAAGCQQTPENRVPEVSEIENAGEATTHLRALHNDRDFDLANNQGEELVKRFPNALELRAWYLISKSRADESQAAGKLAEQMVEEHPESPWSHFALAGALKWQDGKNPRAMEAINRALEELPNHPDVIWLKSAVTANEHGPLAAIAYIDSVTGQLENPAILLAVKGHMQYAAQIRRERGIGPDTDDGPTFEDAQETYRQAIQVDSTCVSAYWKAGDQLMSKDRIADAYPFLKRAAELSTSFEIHRFYWRATMNHPDKPAREQEEEVARAIENLQARRPTTAPMLHQVANQYGELDMPEKQKAYEDRLLEEYPHTTAAEWVLVGRYRDYLSEHREALLTDQDPELVAEFKRMLWDFVQRSQYNRMSLLGDAYRNLFYVMKDDSTVHPDTLLRVVKGMVKHEGINTHITHAEGPIALAERGIAFDYAEKTAREGLKIAREKINERYEQDRFDTEQEYERTLNSYTANFHDALGWIFFHEGQLEKAEEQLLKAHSLDEDNRVNLYHLGRFYETQGQLDDAKQYYAAGLAVQGSGVNPNEDALKDLYRKRVGSLDGYEDYRAALRDEHQARRKQEILNARLDDPRPVPDFTMETLSGGEMSSDVLDGTITVINFWGMWCGPCRREMPDLQKFYEKYRDDPDVQLITVDHHRDRVADVREWVAKEGYEFPVLVDEGYTNDAEISAFPTTWFVGQNGQIQWVKEGWTKQLVQEFSWRVEALRGG